MFQTVLPGIRGRLHAISATFVKLIHLKTIAYKDDQSARLLPRYKAGYHGEYPWVEHTGACGVGRQSIGVAKSELGP